MLESPSQAIFMAWPKPVWTEFSIPHRMGSCVKVTFGSIFFFRSYYTQSERQQPQVFQPKFYPKSVKLNPQPIATKKKNKCSLTLKGEGTFKVWSLAFFFCFSKLPIELEYCYDCAVVRSEMTIAQNEVSHA